MERTSRVARVMEDEKKKKIRSAIKFALYAVLIGIGIKVAPMIPYKELATSFLGAFSKPAVQEDYEYKKASGEIEPYIEYAEMLSYGKAQVNWKYLYAVDTILADKMPEYTRDQRVNYLGDVFFTEENEEYNLLSLELALEKLAFSPGEIENVGDIIDDLMFEGIYPERLQPNTHYMTFINDIKDSAMAAYEVSGVLPSITISQAILESNWGRSSLSTMGNNLFGIKADRSWRGQSVQMRTKEYYDVYTNAGFRVYGSKEQSVADHANFLMENPRYKKHGLFEGKTYREQAQALEDAGYATATNQFGQRTYANQLEKIILQYNLQLLDSSVQEITAEEVQPSDSYKSS